MPRMKGYIPSDRWEREVYGQLRRQLPDDWVVISNVVWSKVSSSREGTSSPYVRDGEADLVVLVPGLGFVVLEVKGSREFRIADDGRWYRVEGGTGREVLLDESPLAQAGRNMHDLKNTLLQKTRWQDFPGLFAFVAVYPQGKLVSPLPPLYDVTTLILAEQMGDLPARLRAALRARGDVRTGERFDTSAVEQVASILSNRPLEITKADTTQDVKADTDGIEVLTRQQFATLRGIFEHPRVAVTGPAGSGKTVLAIWRLAALVEEGRRAVYVCFNTALAEHLRATRPDLSGHIKSVDKWFLELVTLTGAERRALQPTKDLGEFFRETIPNLLVDRSGQLPAEQKCDAIIVDEGQDFGESRLIALLDLLVDERSQYLFFADEGQDLYAMGQAETIGAEVTFRLYHNCRNTTRINATNNLLTGMQVESMPGVPEGVETSFVKSASRDGMAKRAWELARDWSATGGSVAILSPFKLEKSAMAGSLRGHGLELTEDLSGLRTPKMVFFSTIKSFKGIEAASVIVVDVSQPVEATAFAKNDLYVACTRARARLALISTTVDEDGWIQALSSARAPASRTPPAA